jgi:hypothetical protein
MSFSYRLIAVLAAFLSAGAFASPSGQAVNPASSITHPRNPAEHRVDRDYVMLLNAYDIDPSSYMPPVNQALKDG